MPPVKLVKRYANRKLYDTQRRCYATLDELAGCVRAGEEIRVVDNATGADITAVTLAQIIFEREKRRSCLPVALLRDLIQREASAFGATVAVAPDAGGDGTSADAARLLSALLSQSQRAVAHLRDSMAAWAQAEAAPQDAGGLGGEVAEIYQRLRDLEKRLPPWVL